jgi:hypothetical protein
MHVVCVEVATKSDSVNPIQSLPNVNVKTADNGCVHISNIRDAQTKPTEQNKTQYGNGLIRCGQITELHRTNTRRYFADKMGAALYANENQKRDDWPWITAIRQAPFEGYCASDANLNFHGFKTTENG